MSIWDKEKALGKPQLKESFEQDRPFTLWGMELTEPIDFQNGLDPAPVVHLTVSGAQQDKNGDWVPYGEQTVVSIISGPITAMAEEAQARPEDNNFPVAVCWTEVSSRFENKAVVLKHVGDILVDAEDDNL